MRNFAGKAGEVRSGAVILIACVLTLSSGSPGESLVFPPYGHSYGIRKATPAHLFMFFGPRTSFDDPQGLATAKMKSRDDPTTPKDDDEVVVYGVNSGRNQLIYNTSMWTLAIYGSKGSGKDQFLSPKGIATDAAGNVYVADQGNNRIVHLFNPKREAHWVNAFTGRDNGDPGLSSPSQVALDARGLIYVTDTGNRRIVTFDSTGRIVGRYPRKAEFAFDDGPTALAVADGSDTWCYYHNDRLIFCVDRQGSRLWKIGFGGDVEGQAPMPQGHRACYAAVDYYHNLWVTDKENACILKFDHDLKLLDIFGSSGSGDGQFIEPRGIAMWKRFGQTFIAEKKGAQYYWIGTSLKSRQLTRLAGGDYSLSLDVTECSYVTLFRAAGKDTVFFLRQRAAFPGASVISFPAKEELRSPVMRLEPTYSSYTYRAWYYPLTVKP